YTGRPVEPRLEMLEIQPGDRFLLCSDGLSDPVTASTIEEALRQGTPALAAQRLIELALRSGGPDNITVVVADVVASDGTEAPSLPTSPVIAGALVPDHESTHPDSAASRAAALMRAAEVPEPLAEANTAQLKGMKAQRDRGNAVAAPVAAEIPADDEEPLRKRTVWPWVAGALALVLAGVGVVAWLNSRAEDTYTVAANGNNEIAIQRASGSLFSSSEPTDFQLACINSHNELRIASAGDMPQDCTVFTVDDLPPSQQSALENFSGGSYDEAVGLMNRLADAALPVCVEEKAEEKATEKADKESSASETTTCRTES
ncbi:MAG: protein phosphatase, partial [Corynebacterium sp.]|nr:protein phosphatase [Corynebacterium sp.]